MKKIKVSRSDSFLESKEYQEFSSKVVKFKRDLDSLYIDTVVISEAAKKLGLKSSKDFSKFGKKDIIDLVSKVEKIELQFIEEATEK